MGRLPDVAPGLNIWGALCACGDVELRVVSPKGWTPKHWCVLISLHADLACLREAVVFRFFLVSWNLTSTVGVLGAQV